jgi:hypothetical protein
MRLLTLRFRGVVRQYTPNPMFNGLLLGWKLSEAARSMGFQNPDLPRRRGRPFRENAPPATYEGATCRNTWRKRKRPSINLTRLMDRQRTSATAFNSVRTRKVKSITERS